MTLDLNAIEARCSAGTAALPWGLWDQAKISGLLITAHTDVRTLLARVRALEAALLESRREHDDRCLTAVDVGIVANTGSGCYCGADAWNARIAALL